VNLKQFFIRFATRVGEAETSEGENAQFYDYRTYRKTSADSKDSIERRFNIILTKFLEFNQGLAPKDPKRNYDYWEKLAVYDRDKDICQLCSQPVTFDKGTVDHRQPYSKGGPTTLENGQWTCIPCNLAKLNKTQ